MKKRRNILVFEKSDFCLKQVLNKTVTDQAGVVEMITANVRHQIAEQPWRERVFRLRLRGGFCAATRASKTVIFPDGSSDVSASVFSVGSLYRFDPFVTAQAVFLF